MIKDVLLVVGGLLVGATVVGGLGLWYAGKLLDAVTRPFK